MAPSRQPPQQQQEHQTIPSDVVWDQGLYHLVFRPHWTSDTVWTRPRPPPSPPPASPWSLPFANGTTGMFFYGDDGYPIPCDREVQDIGAEDVDPAEIKDQEGIQRHANWVTTMCNDILEDPVGKPVMNGGDSEESHEVCGDGVDCADGRPTEELAGCEVDDDGSESYTLHPDETSTEHANGHDVDGVDIHKSDACDSDAPMVDEEIDLLLLVKARRTSDERLRNRTDSYLSFRVGFVFALH